MTDRSAYWAAYYAKNRERQKAKVAAWDAANRDRKRQRDKDWQRRNRHAIKVRDTFGVSIDEARSMIGEG